MTAPVLPHACPEMVAMIADARVPLTYLPRFREYGLAFADGVTIHEIHYCPFCGAKLPGSVRDPFFDVLDELELEPNDPELPDEMRSDAWWRARPDLAADDFA